MAGQKNLILLLIFSMILWGLSWPAAKITTAYTSTTTLLFLRFFFSALGLLPVLLYFKQPFGFKKEALKSIILASIFICSYNYFFFLALKHGLAGLGGVLVTTLNPLITFFIVALFAREKLRGFQIIGLALGVTGGVFIMRLWELSFEELMQGGNFLFLIAATLWSGLTLASSGAKEYISTITFSFYLYIITAIFSFFLAPKHEILATLSFDGIFWFNMLFISIITTAVATTIYFRASAILGSATASSFIYLVPVTAILGSFLMLGEVPKLTTLIGGVICVLAVAIINRR